MNNEALVLEEFAVIYSLPNSYDFYLHTPKLGEETFHVTDFIGNNFSLTGKTEKIELEEIGSVELHFKDEVAETTFDQYSDTFLSAYGKLSSGELEKVILSRIKKIPFNTKEILNYLFYLKASNVNAFTYLVTSPQTGTWVGATPEKLVQGTPSEYQTMALAGTKPHDRLVEPVWTKKEVHEHEIVANEIEDVLKVKSTDYNRKERLNHKSGSVVHLKTEFTFATPEVNDFISTLHPTSAIAGKPKELALQCIKDSEAHKRELYTGYLGFNHGENAHYFVNLRCMQVHKQAASLYLGGGITKESILEEEWAETEDKAKSLLSPLEKMQKFAGNDF